MGKLTPKREWDALLLCAGALFLLFLLLLSGCGTSPLYPGALNPVRMEPTLEVVALYADAAECLSKDAGADRVTWYSAEQIIVDDRSVDGAWSPPHIIFLTEWVWTHLEDEHAQFVVRHEAVHDLTGDRDHEGEHWHCDGGIR